MQVLSNTSVVEDEGIENSESVQKDYQKMCEEVLSESYNRDLRG